MKIQLFTSLNCNYNLNSLTRYISFPPDISEASFEFQVKIKDCFRLSSQDTQFFILGSTISFLHFLCCFCTWLEKQYFIRRMGYCQHLLWVLVIKSMSFSLQFRVQDFTVVLYLSSSDTRERIGWNSTQMWVYNLWYFSKLSEVVLNLPLPLCH